MEHRQKEALQKFCLLHQFLPSRGKCRDSSAKRPLVQRELPRERVRDCYTIILDNLQISSPAYNSSVTIATHRLRLGAPPPFAQRMLGFWGEVPDKRRHYRNSVCFISLSRQSYRIPRQHIMENNNGVPWRIG